MALSKSFKGDDRIDMLVPTEYEASRYTAWQSLSRYDGLVLFVFHDVFNFFKLSAQRLGSASVGEKAASRRICFCDGTISCVAQGKGRESSV